MDQSTAETEVEYIPPELCSQRSWTQPAAAGPGRSIELVPIERKRPVPEAGLVHGNVVLTGPVHPQIRSQVNGDYDDDDDEFTTVRYSALTCEPSMFQKERFKLRQNLYIKPRRTELLITVPICDESGTDLGRTLTGIFANIQYISSQTRVKTWKRHGWKRCVVCVLADGRGRVLEEAKAVLTLIGLWQPAMAVRDVQGKYAYAHLFEYTTRVRLRGSALQPSPECLQIPVQMILCLNETHQGPRDCGKWLSEAIIPELDPRICVFVPVGAMPPFDAIYRLWERLHLHPRCGGAVGQTEMGASMLTWALNPLAAAYGVHLKLASVLENPLQSFLGFAPAFPTQLSVFRCQLNERESQHQTPGSLEAASVRDEPEPIAWGSRMSDRWLWAFNILSRRWNRDRLDYVRKARAQVQAPSSIDACIVERQHYMQDRAVFVMNSWTTMQNIEGGFRKLRFAALLIYSCLDLVVSWFAIGNTFLIFFFINHYFTSDSIIGRHGPATETGLLTLYTFLLMISVLCALTYQPQSRRLRIIRTLITVGWMLLAAYILIAIIVVGFKTTWPGFHIFSNTTTDFREWFGNPRCFLAILPLLAIYAIWLLISLLFLDPWVILAARIQYVLCIIAHVNFINITTFMYTNLPASGEQNAADGEIPMLTSYIVRPGNKVHLDSPSDDDLNKAYDASLAQLLDPPGPESARLSSRDCEGTQRVYPDKVVLAWALSNIFLCAVILNTVSSVKAGLAGNDLENIKRGPSTIYLLVIFWLIGSFEGVKFTGAILFIIKEVIYFF
ncbi:chitin synthase-domain-containing protein [Aspergillus spinulosporus]